MTDIVFNSVSNAISTLNAIGATSNINNTTENTIQDSPLNYNYSINSTSNIITSISLVSDGGYFYIRPSIIKQLLAGANINLMDNGSYIEINSTLPNNLVTNISTLGDLNSILTPNYTLSQLIGNMSNNNYNSTDTIVQKILDLQTVTISLGTNKANNIDLNNLSNILTNLSNTTLQSSVFNNFSNLIGDISGFSTTSTLTQSLSQKATILSLNAVISNVNNLSILKEDKTTFNSLISNLGNLSNPLVGSPYTTDRSFIDTIGDLSIYNTTKTLISTIGDLSFIQNSNTYNSFVEYVNNIIQNITSNNQNIIGDLTNVVNLAVGYTLSNLIGNPNVTYLSSGSLNPNQIINFASKF